jgi:hypothetical protein
MMYLTRRAQRRLGFLNVFHAQRSKGKAGDSACMLSTMRGTPVGVFAITRYPGGIRLAEVVDSLALS